MKDRSDNPLHHERTLLPWSYILAPYSTNHIVVVNERHGKTCVRYGVTDTGNSFLTDYPSRIILMEGKWVSRMYKHLSAFNHHFIDNLLVTALRGEVPTGIYNYYFPLGTGCHVYVFTSLTSGKNSD